LQCLSEFSSPVQIPELRQRLQKDHNYKISTSQLRKYLKQSLGMRYRVLGVVGAQFDSPFNVLMRQIAASEYIKNLFEGKEVINIDESIIRSSDSRKRGWVQARNRILVSKALRLPQISIITAITNRGRTFFTINKGKNTSATFAYFLTKLCQELDSTDP
jgi:hypothetical protein